MPENSLIESSSLKKSRLNVLVSGFVFSGKKTFLEKLLGNSVYDMEWDKEFSTTFPTWNLSLTPGKEFKLGMDRIRVTNTYFGLKEQSQLIWSHHVEFTYLKKVDLIIYIVDSQSGANFLNKHFFKVLLEDLRILGRDPDEIPFLFVLNKIDFECVESPENLEKDFCSAKCLHFSFRLNEPKIRGKIIDKILKLTELINR